MSWAKDYMIKIEEQGYDCDIDKYVCSNCVGNYAIKKYIYENAEECYCDYCGKKDDFSNISTHLSNLLEIILQGIRSEWTDPNDEVAWDSSEGGWQGVDVLDTYDLIYDIYYDELDIESEELFNDIFNSINDTQWCRINPYSLRTYQEDYYTWQIFCEQVKYETRYVFFKEDRHMDFGETLYKQPYEILETIGQAINELGLIKSEDIIYEFYRGRNHNDEKGYKTSKELATPKKEYAIYDNRMSPAGIPMFYGAFDENTAIEEIGGDKKYITIGVFKNLRKLNLIDLTSIPEIPSIFDSEKRYLRNAVMFLNSFISDISKPIDNRLQHHIDYIPTQIVCEYLRRVFLTNNDLKADGIIYPSSKSSGGKCCVLFFQNEDCTDDENEKDKMLWLDKSTLKRYEISTKIKIIETLLHRDI